VGGKAARREEELLAIDQGLEDFASDPERVGAEISPTGVDTIKGDVHGWRHEGVGGGTAQEGETGTEVLIEDRDFPVQDQRSGRHRGDRRRQLAKPARAVDAVSAPQPDRIALLVRQDPPAVIFFDRATRGAASPEETRAAWA
jgi:hypothetical protein